MPETREGGGERRMSEQETTISISRSDKARLDRFKIHRREPYKEVVSRLLDDLEKLRKTASGGRLPSESPLSYSSFIKGLIESTTSAKDRDELTSK
jgi:hypothetical protein